MADGPLQRYRDLVHAGEINPDSVQALAAEQLQLLSLRLADFRPPSASSTLLRYFFASDRPAPKGLYLFGGVGRGKTMLMDIFYDTVTFAPKERVHFHEFMMQVHGAIGSYRRTGEPDPIPHVARDMAKKARLLCLDEMQITDITDAMIVGRLFKAMFKTGVVLVATSNQPPRALYKDGLNRDLFLPFVDLLEGNMDVLELETQKDYRSEKLQAQKRYFTPLDDAARAGMDAAWHALTTGAIILPAELKVQGRFIRVPSATCGVARFSFNDLCAQPFGARDYLKLTERFHTVLIENIPRLSREDRNEAHRFMTLIDTLYDKGVKIIVSAAAQPDMLYTEGHGVDAFQRTVSRLMEMRSKAYVSAPRKIEVLC